MAIETGDRFHYWKVLKKSPDFIGDGNHKYYYCLCVCHSTKHVRSDDLIRGTSKSCGCQKSKDLMSIVGKKFGRWKVLELGKMIDSHRYALCRCECGFRSEVRISSLKQGQTKSCGCYRDDVHRKIRKGKKQVHIGGKRYCVWSKNYKQKFGG